MRRALFALLLLGGLVIVVLRVWGGDGTQPFIGRDVEPALTTAQAMDLVEGSGLAFGLAASGSPTERAELDAAAALVGARLAILLYFADARHALDVAALDAAGSEGSTPMVSLETYEWTLADIAAGKYDETIRKHADRLADFHDGDGGVVLLRLDHEMNGNWYPWSEGSQGNAKGAYSAAWRHFREVMEDEGTGRTRVLWVWSPNILRGAEAETLISAYPGDAYVDYVGLTGYGNTTYEQTPGETFDATLALIRNEVTQDKPLMITESGAAPGKYKVAWTKELGSWWIDNPDVKAFVWFDLEPSQGASTDWRFSPYPDVAHALGESLATAGAQGTDTGSSP